MAYWGEAGRILFARRGGHLPDANPGMATAAELVERYEAASEAAATDLPFFEAMATAKLAVICAGSMHRMTDQSTERGRRRGARHQPGRRGRAPAERRSPRWAGSSAR